MIQTFPETFRFSGTKTEQEQMIGNAVPVKLGEFIAEAIWQYNKSEAERLARQTSLWQTLFDLPKKVAVF